SFACRPALTASARDGRGDPRSGRGKSLRRGRTEGGGERGKRAPSVAWRRVSGKKELPRIRGRVGGELLVVTPDLVVVGVLELEGELHQGVSDVGRGRIGDGEVVLLLCAPFAGHRVTQRSRPWCGSFCPR